MASGRGNFLRSFMEGLERKPAQLGRGGRKPCVSRGQRGKGPPDGRRGTEEPEAPPRTFGRSDCSGPESDRRKKETSLSKENLMERLPPEILMKILSNLDASSLICISHVSKLLHLLANDDSVWQNIYMSEFGSRMWKPRRDDAKETGSAARWKKRYFWMMAGHEMKTWRRELRDISPNTGLPLQTQWVLRDLKVNWELTICDVWGRETKLQQSRVYFCEASVIVSWNRGRFPKYHHIRNLQLHGVRNKTQNLPGTTRPGWRSLIVKQEVVTHSCCIIGRDGLIKLMHLSPGFIIGIWRGQSSVAFIMASLHLYRLVEKSLLGSPVCPYSEPEDPPPLFESDPEFGLHGYTLHFALHNTGTKMMSGRFHQLSRHTAQMQRGLMELRVIQPADMSQHRCLSDSVQLAWRSESLEGSVENCCFITLTLLDEFQKPFWCVSSPICITAMNESPLNYGGQNLLMEHEDEEGRVDMKLVWLKEQKQFFIISLIIHVPVNKVNKYFSREYSSRVLQQ